MSQNIIIIEPSYTGHHFALYLRLITKAFDEHFNIFLVTTPNAINHPSYKIVERETKARIKVYLIDEVEETAKKNSISLLINQVKILFQFRKAVKKIIKNYEIHHIYINNLDHCDKVLPFYLNPFFGIFYSGLLMSPKFHRFQCNIGNKSRSDSTFKFLFKKLIKQKFIKNIFVIDEIFFSYVNSINLSNTKVKFIYEPTIEKNEFLGKIESRKKLKINFDKFYILVFGGITKRKGVIELVNALNLSKIENHCILIAGSIDEEIEIFLKSKISLDLIKKDKLKIYPGFKSESEQDMFFEACDLVWVGYVEGFSSSSGVFFQAGQYKKPVLANNFGLISYLVKKYNNGLVCNVNDSSEIINCLKIFSSNSIKYELFSTNSSKMISIHNGIDFGNTIKKNIINVI